MVRLLTALIVIVFALPATAQPNEAAHFPSKPIKWIVPAGVGTPPDVLARLFGERLTVALGQPVVIENRPGAIGTVGLNQVARATADGHTVGFMSTTFIIAPSLVAKMPYDTLRDLAPVSMFMWTYSVLAVQTNSPIRSVAELVSRARDEPDTIKYSSAGNGSPPHLTAALLAREAGVKMTHVPYKGAAGSTGLLAGEVDFMFLNASLYAIHARTGKMRALATPSPQRIASHPDVPTLVEVGYPEAKWVDSQGIVAPAATPKAVIARWHAEVAKVLTDADFRHRLETVGTPIVMGSAQYADLLRSESERLVKFVRETGIKVD